MLHSSRRVELLVKPENGKPTPIVPLWCEEAFRFLDSSRPYLQPSYTALYRDHKGLVIFGMA